MATKYWLGTATATAQVDNLTPGGVIEIGDEFDVTLTDEGGTAHTIKTVATGTTVQSVCEDVQAALDASTDVEFAKITWTEDDTKIIGTADTAGVPFYCTVATYESGGGMADAQTFARSAGTANSGPNDWNTALNWSDSAVPVNADNVYFRLNSVSCLYGLNQTAIDLALLEFEQSYTGLVGLADYFLRVGTATALNIGRHTGSGTLPSGSQRIKVNLAATASTINVYNTASTAIDSNQLEPVQLLGTHANNTLTLYSGKVGVAINTPSAVSTLATVNQTGGTLRLPPGVTLTTLNMTAGTCYLGCAATTIATLGSAVLTTYGAGAVTTINATGGTVTRDGTGTVTTLNNRGATVYYDGTGTVTTLAMTGGTTDYTRSRAARTITTPTISAGATFKVDESVVTLTNKLATSGNVSIAATAA